MTAGDGTTVVLVATRAGPDLERSAAAFAAIPSRLVIVDPLGRAGDVGWDCLDAAGASHVLADDIVLAVLQGETPTPELARALSVTPTAPARVRVQHRGRGWTLEPRGATRRLGRWGAGRFGFEDAASRAGASGSRILPGALIAEHGDVDAALEGLDAAADALAALLDDAGHHLGMLAAARGAVATGSRALLGRAAGRAGWGRWIGAALLAYSEILVCAKLLERRGRP